MGKWLVGAGIAILVMLVLLWRTLDDSSATAAPPPAKPVAVAVAEPTTPAPSAAPVEAKPVVEAPAAAPAPEPVKKIDVESDEFFYKFQEVVPAVLSRNAVKCYEGVTKKVHRNQNAVYKFKVKIKDVMSQLDLKPAPAFTFFSSSIMRLRFLTSSSMLSLALTY